MFQSLIISGSDPATRLEKALTILPFEIPVDYINSLINVGITKHPDIYYLTSETSIGIKEIRELESKISLRPVLATHKIALIADAEKLTTEAQNALLKTLEEPPDYVNLILLVKDADLLLSTITSRCQIINLAVKNKEFSKQEFQELEILFEELIKNRVGERLEKTAELAKTREDALKFIENSLMFWRQILLNKYNKTSDINNSALQNQLSSSQILTIIKSTRETQILLQKNINPRLTLDNLLLQWPENNNLLTKL